MYLEDSGMVALSTAFKRPEVAWWMLGFAAPGLQKRMSTKTLGLLNSAPFKFAPANGLATPAGSAQSGRQYLERRRPPQPGLDYFGAVSSSAMLSGSRNSRM